jgi:hypothetical protein
MRLTRRTCAREDHDALSNSVSFFTGYRPGKKGGVDRGRAYGFQGRQSCQKSAPYAQTEFPASVVPPTPFILDGNTQARRPTMQLKLAMDEALPSGAHNATTQYSVVVVCNKCGGAHEMGISVTIENGPVSKQSIGDFYNGKSLPKSLANLTSASVSCPKTGKQSTQKNHHQIFLVPSKS